MPTLKQLTCNVEWSASGPSIPLQEYGTTYFDGLVETWIAVPPVSTPFSVGNHLTLESSPAARHPRPPSAPVEIAGAVSSHVLRHTTMSHPVVLPRQRYWSNVRHADSRFYCRSDFDPTAILHLVYQCLYTLMASTNVIGGAIT